MLSVIVMSLICYPLVGVFVAIFWCLHHPYGKEPDMDRAVAIGAWWLPLAAVVFFRHACVGTRKLYRDIFPGRPMRDFEPSDYGDCDKKGPYR